MPEGVFPKSTGDIWFASEVNRVASAGRYIEIGSFSQVISGTAAQDVGSIVINAGSLTNPCQISFHLKIDKNARDNITIEISGLSANDSIALGSNIATGQVIVNGNMLLGSPLIGNISATAIVRTATNLDVSTINRMKYSSKNLEQLDTSQKTVIKLLGSSISGNFNLFSYGFQAFRSTLSGT